jgi:hypothetical protein
MHVDPQESHREKEAEANQFASSFLMPESTWRRDAPRSTNPMDYLPLKNKWKVSAGAIIRRSKDLGLLTDPQYQTAMVRCSALGFRAHESGMEFVSHEQPRLMNLSLKTLKGVGVTLDSLARQLHLHPENLSEVIGDLQSSPDGGTNSLEGSSRVVKFRSASSTNIKAKRSQRHKE